jgi:hypothetical protein
LSSIFQLQNIVASRIVEACDVLIEIAATRDLTLFIDKDGFSVTNAELVFNIWKYNNFTWRAFEVQNFRIIIVVLSNYIMTLYRMVRKITLILLHLKV